MNPALARDVVDEYTQICVGTYKKSRSFCDCALSRHSELVKEQDAQSLPKDKELLSLAKKKLLANDPNLTEQKIDTICGVHEAVVEERRKASLARQDGDHDLGAQHDQKVRELIDEKEQIARGYNLKKNTYVGLHNNGFCSIRLNVKDKQSYQAQQGSLYGGVVQGLMGDAVMYMGTIIRNGHSHCPK